LSYRFFSSSFFSSFFGGGGVLPGARVGQAAFLVVEEAAAHASHEIRGSETDPGRAIQSGMNGGTGVPPVRTAGTAVPRSDAQSPQSLCIEGAEAGPAALGEFSAWHSYLRRPHCRHPRQPHVHLPPA